MANFTLQQLEGELKRRKSPSSNSYSIEQLENELKRREKGQNFSPTQEESTLNRAGRSLARLPRNALAAAADVGDFFATPIREGWNLGARALGGREIPTLAGEITRGIDTATGGYTKPETNAEKVEEAISRGLISMPVGGALGMAAKGIKNIPSIEGIGNFLRGSNAITPTNVAGTAATTGAIQNAMNKNPEDTSGAAFSGISAGIGASTLPGIASLLTKQGRSRVPGKIGEFLNINPQAINTFENAGITPTLADVSTGRIPKMTTSLLEKTPFASESITKARNLQKSQIHEGLGQGDFGRVLSKGEAGKLATKGAKSYQKAEGKVFSEKKNRLDQDIEKLSKSGKDMVNTKDIDTFFEKEIFSKFKDPIQEELFKESALGKEYTRFHEAAKKNGGKLPYYAIKDMIDNVRDKITTFGEIGEKSQGQLKQLSAQMMNAAEQTLGPNLKKLGKESYNNWKQFRKEYSQYKTDIVPKLNEIYKKDKKSGTDAFIDLMTSQKKGAEKPNIVLKGLPHEDQIVLTDAVHKYLGRTKDGTFSPLKWSREFKGLEPESQKVLLSPLSKNNQNKVRNISDSMDYLKSTLEEANTSQTAYHTTLVAIGTAAYHSGLAILHGNPLPAMELAGGLLLSKITAEKVLTNPKFINWIDKGMKAKNIEHFQKILNHPPKVGEGTKAIARAAQTLQHDINKAKKENGTEQKRIPVINPLPGEAHSIRG